MTIIIEKIVKLNYAATDHDVEALAADHSVSVDSVKQADGTYLRVLIAATQVRLGFVHGKRKPKAPAVAQVQTVLEEIHTRFYAAVLRGVTTPDVIDNDVLSADERRARAAIRNGRAAFARSAASTLLLYARAGGDVIGIDVGIATKSGLRAWVLHQRGPQAHSEVVLQHLGRVQREAAKLIEEDIDLGRAAIEECIAQLQHILEEHPVQAAKVKKAA